MTATIANPELLDKWAKAVGINNDQITRIVVDMQLDDVVRVYVEQWGDAKMNDVAPPNVDMLIQLIEVESLHVRHLVRKAKPCTSPNDRS